MNTVTGCSNPAVAFSRRTASRAALIVANGPSVPARLGDGRRPVQLSFPSGDTYSFIPSYSAPAAAWPHHSQQHETIISETDKNSRVTLHIFVSSRCPVTHVSRQAIIARRKRPRLLARGLPNGWINRRRLIPPGCTAPVPCEMGGPNRCHVAPPSRRLA